jgi:hypothetical protein
VAARERDGEVGADETGAARDQDPPQGFFRPFATDADSMCS